MGAFDILAISGSGVNLNRTWLDAISDNIANISTVRPTSEAAYQARYVEATAVAPDAAQPGGVAVSGIALSSAEGKLSYQPDNPMADAQGMVRLPDVDLSEQMTQLIMAQRGYQANLSVVQRATDAYNAALQIGKG
jgi:flagellar basal-body rod protein FlgC